MQTFEKASVCKVDEGLGLIFGYAIVCKVDGEDYFDKQDDHIPEDSMLEASFDFMLHSRVQGDMHKKDEEGNTVQSGTVVYAFPMTTDIAESLNIQVEKTGLLIAMKPSDPEILQKFKDGTYTGFSIGGQRIEDEDA